MKEELDASILFASMEGIPQPEGGTSSTPAIPILIFSHD